MERRESCSLRSRCEEAGELGEGEMRGGRGGRGQAHASTNSHTNHPYMLLAIRYPPLHLRTLPNKQSPSNATGSVLATRCESSSAPSPRRRVERSEGERERRAGDVAAVVGRQGQRKRQKSAGAEYQDAEASDCSPSSPAFRSSGPEPPLY